MKNERLTDHIAELSTNLDDMTGEAIGFAIEKIFEAGALDVYAEQILMKKNRPAVRLTALASTENADRIAEAIFLHTSAIGIRRQDMERYLLHREIRRIDTEYGSIRVKHSQGYGVSKHKIEYEDIAKLAEEYQIDFERIRKMLEEQITKELNKYISKDD